MPRILLVDDDADDAFLIERRLGQAGVKNPLVQFRDGGELIAFLEGESRVELRSPSLLLLDLKMPAVDGFDVLAWLRNQPRYQQMPVAIVTSSHRPADRARAKEAGATAYFEKFPTAEELGTFVALEND
jgi:CheY-like chemotaxis protein